MTSDQILPGAIVAVIVILIVVGVFRAATRRRGANEDEFGAGGVSPWRSGPAASPRPTSRRQASCES